MADELRDVERQSPPLQHAEEVAHALPCIVEVVVVQHAPNDRQQAAVLSRERRWRAAAVAADDRGDALLEQRCEHVAVIGEGDHPVAVRVHVDEAGGDDLAATVDGAARRRATQVAGGSDAAGLHGDRTAPAVSTGAVEDGPVVQKQIEVHAGDDGTKQVTAAIGGAPQPPGAMPRMR